MSLKEFAQTVKQRVKKNSPRIALGTTALLATVSSASAETINTTAITDVITSMGVILPTLGNLVIAIVPTLMILGVVGFFMGFFDKILGLIGRVF